VISRVLVLGPSGPIAAGPDSAVLNPDASTVAFSTSGTGGVKVWLLEASDMRVAASIALGHGSNAVVFSPAGRSLADTGFGGQPEAARLWRLEAIGSTALNLTASATVPRAPRAFGAAAFSPDGGTLAVSGNTGLSLLDAVTLRTIKSMPAPPGAPGGPVYGPDGKVLAVGGAPGYLSRRSLGGAVYLLDAASLDMITRRTVPDLDAYSPTFSPDGRTLALAGHGHAVGGVVRLLNATSLRTVATARFPAKPA
jgi:Tol biopolymer transport system component